MVPVLLVQATVLLALALIIVLLAYLPTTYCLHHVYLVLKAANLAPHLVQHSVSIAPTAIISTTIFASNAHQNAQLALL